MDTTPLADIAKREDEQVERQASIVGLYAQIELQTAYILHARF
jgi:hypothetical protein